MNYKKAAAVTLAALSLATLSSCRLTTMDALLSSGQTIPAQTGSGVITTVPVISPEQPSDSAAPSEQITIPQNVIVTQAPTEIYTQPPVVITTVPPEQQSEVPQQGTDYSSYSTQQILDTYSKALNLTRSYMGTITVHHKEDLVADAKDVSPGGALTTQLVNTLISRLGQPSELDYKFSGGKALNEDGETIPLLLPQKNNFSLTADGVQRAAIEQVGDQTHVVIRIVPETVGFSDVPRYNSAGIGYLDTASLDLKIVKINSCDITYTGSVIDAYIRSDGYISKVTYTIGLSVKGSVSGLGVTGNGTIEGAQTEVWTLGW